ncbi:MAG: hypothetical protein ABIS47_00070 [Acidimicrobiales bacterium]
MNVVMEERGRVRDLLATSGVPFTEEDLPGGEAAPGSAAAWRFRSEGVAEVDVHVCLDHEATRDALQALQERAGPPSDMGLPAVGQNGRLVFVVSHLGGDDDESTFRTLGVVSAMSGEEE